MHAKSLKIGTNESLTVMALIEARDIARAITVCQMAINLKLARVCMRSLVNRIPQYKKYPKIETIRKIFSKQGRLQTPDFGLTWETKLPE